MSARAELKAALVANLLPQDASYLLVDYSRDLGTIVRPTCMSRLDAVRRPEGVAQGIRVYRFALVLVVPLTAPGPADDQLEGFLEDVLFALQKGPAGVQWTEAKRATFEGRAPAFEVLLDIYASIG